MIRVFIAIPAPLALQEKIIRWEADYENLPVRWLKGKNLHITLLPPWYAEKASLPKFKAQLAEAAENTKTLKVNFYKVSFGPDPKRPRLIWAEGEAPAQLLRLKESANKAFGVKSEQRPFKTHLTLARFKEEDFAGFPIKKLAENVPWDMEVCSIVLMQSRLSRQGADYEILKEIKLVSSYLI